MAERRRPQQSRSKHRVNSILGAAGLLLEEVGYAALTTNAIAARAGTSIGSLYQFFPNKDAVLAELIEGVRDDLQKFFDRSLTVDLARRSISSTVNALVDGLGTIFEKTPGLGQILSAIPTGTGLERQISELKKEIIDPLDERLAAAYPRVTREQRELALMVVTETLKVVLAQPPDDDPKKQSRLREELKAMLSLYLASVFSQPSGKAKGT